jgi:ferredoxin-NADP reductase
VRKSDFIPYDENTEEKTSEAKIVEKNMLNPTTVELTIETEEDMESKPGQFMSFLWKDENGGFPRSYSIAKQEGKKFTFLIKIGK